MKLTRLRGHMQELLLTLGMIVILLIAGIYVALDSAWNGGLMLEGSSVNGVDISGMDAAQAESAVIAALEPQMLDAFSLSIRVGGTTRTLSAQDLSITTDISALMNELLSPLSTGGIIRRADTLYALRRGVDLDFSIQYNAAAVDRAAWAYAASIYQEPTNAQLYIDPVTHEFTYTNEVYGYHLDANALSIRIQEKLDKGDLSPIEAELDVVHAPITRDALRESIVLLSKSEVDMPSDMEQREVITPLVEALNGSVMLPGEDFSLLAALAGHGIMIPREEEPASRLGAAFYTAALRADAVKLERSQNEILPDYIEEGFGAAVSRSQDLVMRTDSAMPLYIVASVKDDSLLVEIYGRRERDMPEIRLRGAVDSVVKPDQPLFITDDTLGKNTQKLVTPAQDGCRVSSYREYYQGDTILKSELLALDRYPAVQAVYRVGSR